MSPKIVHIATYLFVSCAAIFMSAAYRRSSSKYATELQHSEAIGHELLRERDALREANEKFRAVAETASSAILIHDGKRLRYVNRASERLFGYNRDELLSQNMWEIVHPDDRQLLRKRAVARLRGENTPNRYEFKIITKSGEERWLETGAALISFDGNPAYSQMRSILPIASERKKRSGPVKSTTAPLWKQARWAPGNGT